MLLSGHSDELSALNLIFYKYIVEHYILLFGHGEELLALNVLQVYCCNFYTAIWGWQGVVRPKIFVSILEILFYF